jgi:Uma2 family endonuclease
MQRDALTPDTNYPDPNRLYTVDEYLAMERASVERHMFLDGRIIPLDGDDSSHQQENDPMAIPKPLPRYTVDEYLAMERAADERHMYIDGEIFAMAGESNEHGIVSVNLLVIVASQLRGTQCQARTKDTKVRCALAPLPGHKSKGMFYYPDIVVICGEPEFHDAFKDIVINPKVIFEVLSPSTEAFDRGEKFTRLLTCNSTLTDYVLVSQDRPQIEHYQRQADGKWTFELYVGLDAVVAVTSIACSLKLADVFDRVVFPENP